MATLRMAKAVLATSFLAVTAGLAAARQRDLPAACAGFTAGLCNPNADELINSYPLANGPYAQSVCQGLCQEIEDCRYFTYHEVEEACSLFRFRYLASCQVVGGLATPPLAACHEEEESNSCASFKWEECAYSGNVVFNRTAVPDAYVCQSLLSTIGYIYDGVYFVYDSLDESCLFYDSKVAYCAALSGPVLPDMQDCFL